MAKRLQCTVKWLRRLLLGAAALLLLALGIWLLAGPALLERQLLVTLRQNGLPGTTLRVDHAGWRRLVLGNVRLAPDGPSIRRLEIFYSLGGLRQRRIDNVRLSGVRAVVERGADGWCVQGLPPLPATPPTPLDAPLQPQLAKALAQVAALPLNGFELTDVTLVVHPKPGSADAATLRVANFSLKLTEGGQGAALDLDGTFDLALAGGGATGDLALAVTSDLRRSHIRLERGTLQLRRLWQSAGTLGGDAAVATVAGSGALVFAEPRLALTLHGTCKMPANGLQPLLTEPRAFEWEWDGSGGAESLADWQVERAVAKLRPAPCRVAVANWVVTAEPFAAATASGSAADGWQVRASGGLRNFAAAAGSSHMAFAMAELATDFFILPGARTPQLPLHGKLTVEKMEARTELAGGARLVNGAVTLPLTWGETGLVATAGEAGWEELAAGPIVLPAGRLALTGDGARWRLRGDVALPEPGPKLQLHVQADLAKAGVLATVTVPETRIDQNMALLRTAGLSLPPGLTFSGMVDGTVTAAWTPGTGVAGHGRLGFANGQLDWPQKKLKVRGLRTELPITILQPFMLSGGVVQAASIDADNGLLFANATIRFDLLTLQELLVESVEADWCGGRISCTSFRLNPAKPSADTIFYAERLRIGDVFKLIHQLDGDGDGQMFGRFSVRWHNGRFQLGDSFLFALPGPVGSLHLTDDNLISQAISQKLDQATAKRLRASLRDLSFTMFRFDIVPGKEGNSSLRLAIAGEPTNDKSLPPVNLNLNINAPLSALLNLGVLLSQ